MAIPEWIQIDSAKAEELRVAEIKQELAQTDSDMARVGEDLLDVLIGKGVVALTDLPQKAQEAINRRKSKRNEL